jgi:hypothetical protein
MSSANDDLVALIDFGNTLVDETFLWRDSDAFPDWTHHWMPLALPGIVDPSALTWS